MANTDLFNRKTRRLRPFSLLLLFLSLIPLAGLASEASRYRNLRPIAEGAYGKVRLAVVLSGEGCGEVVAIKTVPLFTDDTVTFSTVRELLILSQVRGMPNLVQLRDVFFSHGAVTKDNRRGRYLNLVLEYKAKNLLNYIDDHPQGVSFAAFKKIARGLFRGLEGLHHCNILHTDIKPANILLSGDEDFTEQEVVLADFGISQHLPAESISSELTPLAQFFASQAVSLDKAFTTLYRPPEVLLGGSLYDSSADMWALGVVLYQLYCGHHLVFSKAEEMWDAQGKRGPDYSEIGILLKIFEKIGTPQVGGLHRELASLPYFNEHLPKWHGSLRQELAQSSYLQGSEEERGMASELIVSLLSGDPSVRRGKVTSLSTRHLWLFENSALQALDPAPWESAFLPETPLLGEDQLPVFAKEICTSWVLEIFVHKGLPFSAFHAVLSFADACIGRRPVDKSIVQLVTCASMAIMVPFFAEAGELTCGEIGKMAEYSDPAGVPRLLEQSLLIAAGLPHRHQNSLFLAYEKLRRSPAYNCAGEQSTIAHLLLLILSHYYPLRLEAEELFMAITDLALRIAGNEGFDDSLSSQQKQILSRVDKFFADPLKKYERLSGLNRVCLKNGGTELLTKIENFAHLSLE